MSRVLNEAKLCEAVIEAVICVLDYVSVSVLEVGCTSVLVRIIRIIGWL